MQRFVLRRNILSTAGALSLLAGVAACGDDGGTNSTIDAASGPDSALPDAGAMADGAPIDALDPTLLRAGTVAVSEVRITNNLPTPGPVAGAAVTVTYTDLTSVSVAPTYDPTGTGAVPFGDCAVWVYDATTDQEPAVADEGPITISGALSPIGTCVFSQASNGYVCPFATGTVVADTIVQPLTGENVGTARISWPTGDEFLDKDVQGMFVRFDGFAEPGNNGVFPIVNKVSDDILVIANPDAVNETAAAGSEPSYTVLAGAGPTPAAREFLDDSTEITVQKGDGPVVAEFQTAVAPSGNGLTLGAGSAQPHLLPNVASQDITFTCGGTGGDCGPSPTEEDAIYGFVLSGRTTDGDISGLTSGFDVLTMPDPVAKYAVFQCRGVLREDSITIPRAAMEIILSTLPNRIETRLLRVTADLSQVPSSVVVGHGLVGYSDTNLSTAQ